MMGMHQPNWSVHQNKVNATDAIGDESLSMTCATMPSTVSRRMTFPNCKPNDE